MSFLSLKAQIGQHDLTRPLRAISGQPIPSRHIKQGQRQPGIDTSGPFGFSRRSLLAGLAATPIATGTTEQSLAQTDGPRWTPQQAQAALQDAKDTKLVLLGTAAGPVPGRSREMTSHVMLSNGLAYVLDCGMGVTNQFARTGIPFSALKSIFITHYHADHNIEYGPLLIVGWIQGQSGCRLRKSGHQKMSANNPKQYYVHLPEHVQIAGLGIDSASVA